MKVEWTVTVYDRGRAAWSATFGLKRVAVEYAAYWDSRDDMRWQTRLERLTS